MEYMKMCIAHDLFTCGDNNQYGEVIAYYDDLKKMSKVPAGMTEILVYMTWICSDTYTFSVDDVRNIINNSLIFNL